MNRIDRMTAVVLFFFSSRRRHTRFDCDWSSDVCSSDLLAETPGALAALGMRGGRGGRTEELLVEVLRRNFKAETSQSSVIQASFTCADRSEERRVGKECRSRGSPYH